MAEPKEDLLQVVCVLVRVPKKKRRAKDELERWAERSLIHLFQGRRFSERDEEFGDSLASQLQGTHKLSEAQWEHAVKLTRRYQEHVAAPPDPRQLDLLACAPPVAAGAVQGSDIEGSTPSVGAPERKPK